MGVMEWGNERIMHAAESGYADFSRLLSGIFHDPTGTYGLQDRPVPNARL